MYWNVDFVSFIFMVKLKCNRGQTHGINRVLANIVRMSKIQYTVIHFYCNLFSYKKNETSYNDFSFGCGAKLAYQATPKLVDDKWHLFSVQYVQSH
jgi:hypothetical protein